MKKMKKKDIILFSEAIHNTKWIIEGLKREREAFNKEKEEHNKRSQELMEDLAKVVAEMYELFDNLYPSNGENNGKK